MRNDELYHYGVLGMKWGVRRYQRKDGTWTGAGKARRKRTEPHTRKKLTKAQKEKLKKVAKYAALGTAGAGLAVGGVLLAKRLKNAPRMDYASAVLTKAKNLDSIRTWTDIMNSVPKGSADFNLAKRERNILRKDNKGLTATIVKTGVKRAVQNTFGIPNRMASYGLTKEGQEAGAKLLKDNYSKFHNAVPTALAGVVGGATAYAGAAAADKLFDEQRDKRIARRNGQQYIKRNMNARASDYMFPRKNYT